ncbi:MAG: hypothetical protein II998_06740 [Clostridia bacterium]|nr:hypothetical protein [Clostridia bacterium]
MWKDNFEIIDFHSHILYGVDDGSDSLSMSLEILRELLNQGVDKVVSTSHYYNFREPLHDFLARRDDALYNLERHIKEHDLFLPEIVCGAEVRLYPGLWQESELDRLCIGNTRNILIEMPYDNWTPWMYNEIYSVASKGYTPVMAHVERYVDFVSTKEIIQNLLSLDVLIQFNCDSFEDRPKRRFMKKIIKSGYLPFLGSDCHNTTTRKPCINAACEYISKKYSDSYLKDMMNYASETISEN